MVEKNLLQQLSVFFQSGKGFFVKQVEGSVGGREDSKGAVRVAEHFIQSGSDQQGDQGIEIAVLGGDFGNVTDFR